MQIGSWQVADGEGGKGGKYRRATMSQESCGRANTWTTSPPLNPTTQKRGLDWTGLERQRERRETAEDAEGGDRLSPVHPLKRHWNHTGERGEQGVGL